MGNFSGRLIAISFSFYIILCALISRSIFPIHYENQNFFFSELINHPLQIPYFLNLVFVFINPFLIYLTAKKFFAQKAFIPFAIFCLSPWSAYLGISYSSYNYLLTFTLMAILGLSRIQTSQGKFLFVSGIILSSYSSILMLITAVLFSVLSWFMLPNLRSWLKVIFILLIPLFLLMFLNKAGTENLFHLQAGSLFSHDIFNINDNYRGQSIKGGFGYLAKIVENKLDIVLILSLFKLLQNLSPQTYFTALNKLLNFSNTPPIFLGFLPLFLTGVYKQIRQKSFRNYLPLFLILLLPALLSERIPDLNRLLIFEPVLIFFISQGIVSLVNTQRFSKIILFGCLLLVLIQINTTLFDIGFREFPRHERYFNYLINFVIDKQ